MRSVRSTTRQYTLLIMRGRRKFYPTWQHWKGESLRRRRINRLMGWSFPSRTQTGSYRHSSMWIPQTQRLFHTSYSIRWCWRKKRATLLPRLRPTWWDTGTATAACYRRGCCARKNCKPMRRHTQKISCLNCVLNFLQKWMRDSRGTVNYWIR